jgi:hypothetical protein
MDTLDMLRIRLELQELNAAFVHHLDHGEIDALVGLFTEQALYTHGGRRSAGRAEIRQLFERRAAAGTRTVRHLQSGLRLLLDSADRARGSSVCLTFVHEGPPPAPQATPHLVADFIDTYERDESGRWRIAQRHIERLFVAPDNPGPVGMPPHGEGP